MPRVKYSILLPLHNGGRYLQDCVESVLRQPFPDFELIVSDDHSTDGAADRLHSRPDPRLRLTAPPRRLSMAEHWEFLLNQARGEWLIFVGQDDGLQLYFFELAERLTARADREGLRAIMSERALFFWPGCEKLYGDRALYFRAEPAIRRKSCRLRTLSALLGLENYFELPQMYTTSLFRRELLDEARRKLGGQIFVTHPQDANLAAIAVSLERKFLFSGIPLGWVGTSPRSAGMAISGGDAVEVRRDYLEKIATSALPYDGPGGDFRLASTELYFWNALLATRQLRTPRANRRLRSRWFRLLILAAAECSLRRDGHFQERHELFRELLHRNRCSSGLVRVLAMAVIGPLRFGCRGAGFLLRRLRRPPLWLRRNRAEAPELTLLDAAGETLQRLREAQFPPFDRTGKI